MIDSVSLAKTAMDFIEPYRSLSDDALRECVRQSHTNPTFIVVIVGGHSLTANVAASVLQFRRDLGVQRR